MFKNYIKIAFRSLLRHRFFSAINIIGLAVAMSISMMIIMLVADQMRSDRHNSKRDRIYRVVTTHVNNKGVVQPGQQNATSSMPLKQELLEKYSGLEKVVRIKRGFGNNWLELENQNVNIPLAGFYADPEVFDLFEYEFQYGDPATALKEPYSVVLTRKAANKLFKEENPLGLTIKVGEAGTFTVTGVLRDTDRKSHMVFEALASMSTLKSRETPEVYAQIMENWTDFWNGWTYILLEPGKTPADIQVSLERIYQEHIAVIDNPDQYLMKYDLQAMTDITPGPLLNNEIGPVTPWFMVYALAGLALVILLTSCFNFTNLSIARSLTRAREIGVRKATGAARWQIFIQFLSESVIVAFLALAGAMILVIAIKPVILQLNFARIFRWDLEANIVVFGIFVLFATVVGMLAGFFPAVVLSGFQPVAVLKGMKNTKLFSRMGLRKVLLVTQFTLSLFFILSVIVMHNQLKLFITKDYGFNMKNNIAVKLNDTKSAPLKAELLKHGNVLSVSASSHVPSAGTSNGNGFKKDLRDQSWTDVSTFEVDEDYVKNMELTLVAGKFYSAENGEANKKSLVINEETVKAFQFGSPLEAIGQELHSQWDSAHWTIIGVVKDYNHRDLMRTISPMALLYNPDHCGFLQVQYAGSYENAVHTVESSWATINPGLKVDYEVMESSVRKFYDIIFGDMIMILGVIASLAIMISCLGLLGMATYTTETRLKEISIRKVLGSGSWSLIMLLSKGFLMILALAILIGVPAAYFVNNLWLELIAYHTTIDLAVIGTGVVFLLLFGVITIGSQTIRATFVNPAENLKSE